MRGHEGDVADPAIRNVRLEFSPPTRQFHGLGEQMIGRKPWTIASTREQGVLMLSNWYCKKGVKGESQATRLYMMEKGVDSHDLWTIASLNPDC